MPAPAHAPSIEDQRRGSWRVVAALAAGGALLRAAGQLAWRYDDVDSIGLLALASDLASGAGSEARDLAYWPPLPSALTALLATTGLPVRVAGLLLVLLAGSLTVFPAAWLGRALGGRRAMLWAAAGAAFLPPLVVSAQRFHAEPLAGLCLLGAACLVPTWRWRRPHLAAVGVGMLAALAWLSRFELLATVPLLLAALALLPIRASRRQRLAQAGLGLLGFALLALPYASLLDHLGHGFGLIPQGRVNANLTFTLSGNAVSYGLPGAPEAAADAAGGTGAAWDQRRALLRQVLQHLQAASLWRAILRMVTPSLLLLALLGLRRSAQPETRRLEGLLLLLGLPSLAALVIIDDNSRYWYPWTLLALPLAAAELAHLLQARGLGARLSPLLALGLLALPSPSSPDAPLPVRAPGEAPAELLSALVHGRLDPSLVLSPSVGWISLVVPPLLLLVTVVALGATLARRGRRLTPPLLAAAALCSLLVLHQEHRRTTTPTCHFQENMALLSIGAGTRIAAASSLDAYVLGEPGELTDVAEPGVWVPAPRRTLSLARQQAWWAAQQPDLLVVDVDDPASAPILAHAQRQGLPQVASTPADSPHLVVYAATPAGRRSVNRWLACCRDLAGPPQAGPARSP